MERKLTAVLAMVFGVSVAAHAQTGQQPASGASNRNEGGCYDTDASGKEVFIPNCGLPSTPGGKVPATSPAQSSDPGKQFPFPGQAIPAQDGSTAPALTTPPSGAAPKSFPFPGEDTSAPLVQPDGSIAPTGPGGANPGGLKDAGSSGDSSSGESSSSSSSASGLSGLPDDPAEKGPLADDDTVIKKPRRKVPVVAKQTDAQRVDEDLSVAEFYMNDKNFRGAYTRAADAVATLGDDPNAQFALAEAARKLGKLDEALTHYKRCIELDPIPKQKKASEKAIKEMAGGV